MNSLPEEMWFGNISGQWPIHCWESDRHAMAWLEGAGADEVRRVWKAKIHDPIQYELRKPQPYLSRLLAEA